MGCVSPIRVLNPTLHYEDGKDKLFVDCPCGKCYSCRQQNASDWFIRSYFQVKDTADNGGVTYMFTLTYNDSCLPHFKEFVNIPELSEYPCFCKYDVVTFFDSLRHFLRKNHGLNGLKYLITSEYGEHTKRPHYHLVLHLPKVLNPYYVLHLVEKYWHYGYVYISRNKKTGELAVSGHYASKYVSKYICKDLSYCEIPAIKVFSEDDNYKDVLRPFMPFHLQSKGYGSSICDFVLSNPLKYFIHGINLIYDNKCYNLPRYIINKLCYSYRDDGSRYLNDFGIYAKTIQFDTLVDRESVSLQHDMSFIGLSRYFDNGIVSVENIYRSVLDNDCSCGNLHRYFHGLLNGRSFKLLAYYKLFFVNRVCTSSSLRRLCRCNENEALFSSLRSFYLDSLCRGPVLSDTILSFKNVQNKRNLFSDMPIFKDFDIILSVLRDLKNAYSIFKNHFSEQKDYYVNSIKQRFM